MKSPRITLLLGDTVERLRQMPDESVAAFVVDPPYGLEFMGKEWDRLDLPDNWQNAVGFSMPGIGERKTAWPSFTSTTRFGAANPTCDICGGRLRGAKKCSCPQPHDHWKCIGKRRKLPQGTPDPVTGGGMTEHLRKMQAWHTVWLAEAYRVLKPGGTIKAFSATRTMHRLAAAMRDVGFDIVRIEAWVYGSGFPKSLNVSKAVDAYLLAGRSNSVALTESEATRPVVGTARRLVSSGRVKENEGEHGGPAYWERWNDYEQADIPVTAPRSPEAQRFDGYGTALKPAWEPFIVGRKPVLEV